MDLDGQQRHELSYRPLLNRLHLVPLIVDPRVLQGKEQQQRRIRLLRVRVLPPRPASGSHIPGRGRTPPNTSAPTRSSAHARNPRGTEVAEHYYTHPRSLQLYKSTRAHARDRGQGDDDQPRGEDERAATRAHARRHAGRSRNASRQDRLGGDVEPGAVVAGAGALLRAVAQPRRRREPLQDGRLLLPLLPGRVPAALAREPLQGVLLLALLRQGPLRRLVPARRRRWRREARRGWRRRRRGGAPQPLDEGGGHRGGGAPHGGRRRRRRPRRRLLRAPQEGALRARLRRRLLRALRLLRPHPLGRQPQPEARRLRQQRYVPQLRDPGGDGRVAGADGDVDDQRHGEAHFPQHGELLRRARHGAARHALLLPAPHGLRRYEVLLPASEEPAQGGGDGGRQQGAAVRRRRGAEQHPGAQGRAASAGAAAADAEDQGAGAGAGQAGQAHVLQQRAVQRPPGHGQAGQARLPQEILHPRLATLPDPTPRRRHLFFLLPLLLLLLCCGISYNVSNVILRGLLY